VPLEVVKSEAAGVAPFRHRGNIDGVESHRRRLPPLSALDDSADQRLRTLGDLVFQP
jgi:hypothetical protein